MRSAALSSLFVLISAQWLRDRSHDDSVDHRRPSVNLGWAGRGRGIAATRNSTQNRPTHLSDKTAEATRQRISR